MLYGKALLMPEVAGESCSRPLQRGKPAALACPWPPVGPHHSSLCFVETLSQKNPCVVGNSIRDGLG